MGFIYMHKTSGNYVFILKYPLGVGGDGGGGWGVLLCYCGKLDTPLIAKTLKKKNVPSWWR